MPAIAVDEVLYVLDESGERESLPLRELSTDGYFEVWSFEGSEADLMVRLASDLGLGEAACLTIGITRKMAIATDDLYARRRARQLAEDVELITTGQLVQRWAESGVSAKDVTDCILSIETRARYRPPVADPAADWWVRARCAGRVAP